MIAGEHAVLHGKHALVAAVDQRVTVTLAPRGDDTIMIHSGLGAREMPREAIDDSAPFHFLGAVLKKYNADLPGGCDLTITADFPHNVGLGSSAAVTVAALAAIRAWLTGALPGQEDLMQGAVAVIRDVQGMGSGADVAAAVFGGVLLYKATPEVIARYPLLPTPHSPPSTPYAPLPPISLVYAGYKTPTPQVIRIVEQRRALDEHGYARIFDKIDAGAISAAAAMEAADWRALGIALNSGQQMMEELGVSDETLADIVSRMNASPRIFGAKISGSGLGDCVLGIGTLDAIDWTYREIPVELSLEGVRLEQ